MKKYFNWQLMGCAFVGGIVLSLMDLSTMFKQHQAPDIYSFGGMVIAGLIGIIGYFMAGANTARTAFVSGISAPQLLGGLVKAGAATAQSVALLISPISTAYAGVNDSVKIVAIVQGVDSAQIITNKNNYKVSDVTRLTIKKQDTIIVSGNGFSEAVALNKKSKEIILKISVLEVEQEQKVFHGKYLNVMRGMFAQDVQPQDKTGMDKKVEITVE